MQRRDLHGRCRRDGRGHGVGAIGFAGPIQAGYRKRAGVVRGARGVEPRRRSSRTTDGGARLGKGLKKALAVTVSCLAIVVDGRPFDGARKEV